MIVAGMGELHLDVSIVRLRRENKLNLEVKPQRVSYRETIRKKTGEIKAEIKKQSGGSGSFARISVIFEPNPGKGYKFENKIVGDAVSKKFANAVGEGIKEALFNGNLLGYPTIDVKASLVNGQSHTVDSKDSDFRDAGIIAFRGKDREERERRIQETGTVLLEPIMNLEVIITKEYVGEVLAKLGSLRVSIESTDEEGNDDVIIRGKAPLKEMLNFSTSLRQITKGRGVYSMEFFDYKEVNQDILEEIIEQKSKENLK